MRNRSGVMFITILIQGKDIKMFKVIYNDTDRLFKTYNDVI